LRQAGGDQKRVIRMGFFRLILAIMVVLSHLAIYAGTMNPGVFAVCCFFLLSGYVMTALADKHFAHPRHYGLFIADRAMRLYPQYLLYMALTGLLIVVAHPPSGYLSDLRPIMVLANLAMIPIGYSAVYSPLSNALIIPPAATLGLEFTFYLVFPFLLWLRWRIAAMVLSFAIFVLAYAGIIGTDTWGYRLLPGTLFTFMLGSVLRRGERRETLVVWVIYGVCVALLMMTFAVPSLRGPFNREMLWGVTIGLPMLRMLATLPDNRWDALAGNLSYGVFLNHFLLILTFQSLGKDPVSPSLKFLVFFVGTSLLCAALSYYFLERPVIHLRHRIRRRRAA
jgi:peptidoglycan/LPS O-acetylase OafA/YrhL